MTYCIGVLYSQVIGNALGDVIGVPYGRHAILKEPV